MLGIVITPKGCMRILDVSWICVPFSCIFSHKPLLLYPLSPHAVCFTSWLKFCLLPKCQCLPYRFGCSMSIRCFWASKKTRMLIPFATEAPLRNRGGILVQTSGSSVPNPKSRRISTGSFSQSASHSVMLWWKHQDYLHYCLGTTFLSANII